MFRRYAYGSRDRSGFNDLALLVIEQVSAARGKCDAAYNAWLSGLNVPASTKAFASARRQKIRSGKASRDTEQTWYALRKASAHLVDTRTLWQEINRALKPYWWQWRHRVFAEMRQRLRQPLYDLAPVITRQRSAQGQEGSLSYRFSRPVSVEKLLSGKTPVTLQVNGRYANLSMPVARQNGVYENCSWDFTWHRDLPAAATVHEVSVSGSVKSGQWRLSVVFLVELPDTEKVPVQRVDAYGTTAKHYACGHENRVTRSGDIFCGHCKIAYDRDINAALWLRGDENVVGIDVGWRLTRQGLRVATAALGSARFETLHLPPAWVLGWDYVEDLDAVLNKSAITACPELSSRKKPWMDLENMTSDVAMAWQQKTRRMRRERYAKSARLARWRLDIYRRFAHQLAATGMPIRMEKLKLKNMMRANSSQGPAQKQQQQMAAVSELQRVIEEAI